ncbi:MAG: SDR family NAD(P)-dependent oxidoreductase [bacterium]|nr:SDR family NAD(P)-dependent oxidoreductase [bacterium]
MKTYLITGSTSGLGLEIVKNLAKNPKNRVIMAIRNLSRGLEIAQETGSNVEAVQLDLSQLSNITAFIEKWDLKIDGLINNAGVQFVDETNFTPDGFEETIAVNHLAAFMLTIGLQPYLENGRVLFIGSGTHNPHYPYGKMFGFRGAQYTSIRELLRGTSTAPNTKQMNLDRYATSKLLNTITAVELSRRFKNISSYALDPGLMPGTGLARKQSKTIQFLWKKVMPVMGFVMPDTSTAKRSGKAAAWIITSARAQKQPGTIYSYNKKPNVHVWKEVVSDEKIGSEVYEDSMKIIQGSIS